MSQNSPALENDQNKIVGRALYVSSNFKFASLDYPSYHALLLILRHVFVS